MASFLYPLYHFTWRSLRSGTLPLWNPHLYSGAPLAADIQTGVFYPVNWAFFLMSSRFTYRTVEAMAIFHIWLAGAAMYLCLRYMRDQPMSRFPALAGALAFMFSDLFITHIGNLNMIAVGAWLPLIFLCYRRALASGQLKFAPLAGLFLGLASLAGHIQPLLYILLLLGLYLAYRLVLAGAQGRQWLPPLFAAAVTFMVGFGVSALLLLPSYEMSRLSVRAQLTYQQAAEYSLSTAQLTGMLVPALFGRGPAGYWGPWLRVEVGYIGVLPLLLAFLGALLARERELTRFLVFVAILSLLLALGEGAILHGWLYQFVPGLNLVRAPARFIYIMDFALAVLAAYGLEVLLQPMGPEVGIAFRRLLKFLSWGFLGLVVFALPLSYAVALLSLDKGYETYRRLLDGVGGISFALLVLAASLALLYACRERWVGPHSLGWLAIGIIIIDLFSLGAYTELQFSDPTVNYHHPLIVDFLRRDPNLFRIDTRTGAEDIWQPDAALLHGLYDVGGVYNPLLLADYDRYWGNMHSRSTLLYDMLNAKYLIGHKTVPLDWDKYELVFDGDPELNVYRNRGALPGAFIVHRAVVVEDHQAAFDAIQGPGFDPGSLVVLEEGQPLDLASREGETTRILRYSANDLLIEISVKEEGYLVLSELYYPGWRAYVDGQAQQVLRANYAFRAVRVGPGSRWVRLVFSPTSWRIGLSISMFTWVSLLLGGVGRVILCYTMGKSVQESNRGRYVSSHQQEASRRGP